MDKHIREGIDACRPGSSDLPTGDIVAGDHPTGDALAHPELAAAARAVASSAEVRRDFERIGRWDSAICQVVERVAVPAGLADRILARLHETTPDTGLLQSSIAAATASLEMAEQEAGEPRASETQPTETRSGGPQHQVERPASPITRTASSDEWIPQSWRLRNWSGTTLTIITATVLLVAGGVWIQMNAELPVDMLAQRWREELGNKWQPVAQAPRDFPLPEAMRGFSSQWQWIDRLTPTPVVAYELTHGKAGKAMLYVARMARPELRTSPPLSPQPSSVGQAMGYWRSGDVVYVLVAPDVLRYQAFVRSSSAPLARVQKRAARPILRPPVANYRTTRKIA